MVYLKAPNADELTEWMGVLKSYTKVLKKPDKTKGAAEPEKSDDKTACNTDGKGEEHDDHTSGNSASQDKESDTGDQMDVSQDAQSPQAEQDSQVEQDSKHKVIALAKDEGGATNENASSASIIPNHDADRLEKQSETITTPQTSQTDFEVLSLEQKKKTSDVLTDAVLLDKPASESHVRGPLTIGNPSEHVKADIMI